MPIYSQHHVIPDAIRGQPVARIIQAPLNNTNNTLTSTTTTTTTSTTNQVLNASLGSYALASLIALILVLVAASLILVVGYRREPRLPQNAEAARGRSFLSTYTYPGARAILRSVFLQLRAHVEKAVGAPLSSKTAYEIAGIIGGGALRFARKYSYLMYSNHQPGEEEVRELSNLVEGLVEEWRGSRG